MMETGLAPPLGQATLYSITDSDRRAAGNSLDPYSQPSHLLRCPCRHYTVSPWLRDTLPLSILIGRCSASRWLLECTFHCCYRALDNPQCCSVPQSIPGRTHTSPPYTLRSCCTVGGRPSDHTQIPSSLPHSDTHSHNRHHGCHTQLHKPLKSNQAQSSSARRYKCWSLCYRCHDLNTGLGTSP